MTALMLPMAAGAAPTFTQTLSSGNCPTVTGGVASSSVFPSEALVAGRHLVIMVATDSVGPLTISDTAGNSYTSVANASVAITGGTVSMVAYVTRMSAAPTSVTVNLSSGTNGRELCVMGEEFSGGNPSPPYIERNGFQSSNSADPLTVGISQPTATADQTLVASFARYNFPGGSGVQPYPLHAQTFSQTNAELSLDIGSGPALTAGSLYARQFDPNSAIPYVGLALTLLPISNDLFKDGFE